MKIRIRRILVPVFLCLAIACLIEIPLAETTIFGEAVILWDTLFRAIVAAPVLFHYYREDHVFRGKEQFNAKTAVLFLAVGVVLSLVFSAVIRAFHLPGVDAANATLFVEPLWLQFLVLFIASPLLEELFFRGVLYGRLKELIPTQAAIMLSAVVFGLYHANLGQGLYGFFMGIFLAWAMERCQTVKAPLLIHIAANAAAVVAALANLP